MSEQTEQRLELARHYLAVGNPERALDALAQTTAVDDEDYWELRAGALLDLDRWEDAAEAARNGLALDPDDFFLLDMLAIAELELEHGGAALEAIDAALALVPDHPTLLAHRALILARLKRFDEAEHAIDEAMAIGPDSVDVLRVRSQVSFLKGDLGAAKQHVDLVIDEALETGKERELSTADLETALKGMRPSTLEWLSTARNYVDFANQGGRYDEVAAFLVSREVKSWR